MSRRFCRSLCGEKSESWVCCLVEIAGSEFLSRFSFYVRNVAVLREPQARKGRVSG